MHCYVGRIRAPQKLPAKSELHESDAFTCLFKNGYQRVAVSAHSQSAWQSAFSSCGYAVCMRRTVILSYHKHMSAHTYYLLPLGIESEWLSLSQGLLGFLEETCSCSTEGPAPMKPCDAAAAAAADGGGGDDDDADDDGGGGGGDGDGDDDADADAPHLRAFSILDFSPLVGWKSVWKAHVRPSEPWSPRE